MWPKQLKHISHFFFLGIFSDETSLIQKRTAGNSPPQSSSVLKFHTWVLLHLRLLKPFHETGIVFTLKSKAQKPFVWKKSNTIGHYDDTFSQECKKKPLQNNVCFNSTQMTQILLIRSQNAEWKILPSHKGY